MDRPTIGCGDGEVFEITHALERSFRLREGRSEPGACWNWQGPMKGDGYGLISGNCGGIKRLLRAHRVAYALYHRQVQPDAIICHRCNNRRCVNPAHLYAGDPVDNSFERMAAKVLA